MRGRALLLTRRDVICSCGKRGPLSVSESKVCHAANVHRHEIGQMAFGNQVFAAGALLVLHVHAVLLNDH